ncbi:DUF6541 family protein [Brachybacterium sp. GCM10030267]|uniref:DUF6541 family protein n=1 Tax=Brachybacterium sp. GCM10030267 TaxID=3273381 RepID=UPI00361789B6
MWTDVIPGVLVAAALFVIPGAAVLLCCRAAVPTALVGAPAVSLGVIALSALAAGALDAFWHVTWVVGATLVCAAACALWFWATPWGRRTPTWSILPGTAALQYLGGQVIASVFMVPLYLSVFVEPSTIAQRFDNAFHLNAIEAIQRTGEATPFATGALLRGSIYPNGWHTAAALVQDLSGLDLAPAVHSLALITVLAAWPMSMWLLLEVLVRPSPAVRLLCGPLLLAFPGFPLVLIDWGLVYPTILGLAVVPALSAALLHMVLRRTLLTAPVQTCLIVVLSGIGAGMAHPGGTLAGLILVLPIPAVLLARHLETMLRAPRDEVDAGARHLDPSRDRGARTRVDVVWAVLLGAVCAAIVLLWLTLTPSTATAPWDPFQSSPQAIGEALVGGAMGRPTLLVVSLLCGIGLVGALVSRARGGRDRLVMLALIGPAAVYWASSASTDDFWRDLLSGYLYRDNFRTAAALTLAAVPVAAMGLEILARGVRRAVDGLAGDSGRGPARVLSSTAAAVIVGLLGSTALAWHVSANEQVRAQFDHASDAYRTWETSDLVSEDEFRMFEELPDHVEEDGYVIADPWEGGGLVYAFADRDVSRLYMTVRRTPEEKYLDANFEDVATDPRVCEALPEDRPLYYLDLDDHRLGRDDPAVSGYLGYQDITEDTPGFDLVHAVGEVRLYEVDAC